MRKLALIKMGKQGRWVFHKVIKSPFSSDKANGNLSGQSLSKIYRLERPGARGGVIVGVRLLAAKWIVLNLTIWLEKQELERAT